MRDRKVPRLFLVSPRLCLGYLLLGSAAYAIDRPKYGMHHILYKITCLVTNNWYLGMHSTAVLEDGYLGSGRKIIKSGSYQTRPELVEAEKALITWETIFSEGCLNRIPGGNGGDTSQYTWADPVKRERAIRKIAAFYNKPGVREAARKRAKDRWAGSNLKLAVCTSNSARWEDPEFRAKTSAKMRLSMKGVKKPPRSTEHRENLSRSWTQEKRLANSTKMSALKWVNEEGKDRRVEASELESFVTAGFSLGRSR